MQSLKLEKINRITDYLGLSAIGLVCFSYSLFYERFAKLHLDIPLVKAPLFIGEFTFLVCASLFIYKWMINGNRVNALAWIFIIYCGFIEFKIISGYLKWGPLALRHAVLFLYPLFAVFSYSFFKKEYIKKYLLLLYLIIASIFLFYSFHEYFSTTGLVLATVLIQSYPKRITRYFLYLFLFIKAPLDSIFNTSRAFILGNMLALGYIFFFALLLIKIKTGHKILLGIFITLLIFLGLYHLSSKNELKSIFGFDSLVQRYDETNAIFNKRKAAYTKKDLRINLYNKEQNANLHQYLPAQLHPELKEKLIIDNKPHVIGDKQPPNPVRVNGILKEKKNTELQSPVLEIEEPVNDFFTKIERANVAVRSFSTSLNNAIFRIYIWRDVLSQLREKPLLFGYDFGKPFRSQSLEILGWGESEWMRDGWICIHNSYLDLIYRSGVIGVFMIIAILISIIVLTVKSLALRSLKGIMLTGILVNWFVAANFLEILEMPYSAIPLWSLFGMTFATLFKENNS